jgi:DNA (cytosine-5)-methyltransferase 1
MAGIDVVKSYEWWSPANTTHGANFGTAHDDVDIRQLKLADLPKRIDIVVGSPPCTQFSYANRGGSGDISDGLVDVRKFLEVVAHLKPKYWAMENVPRVATILREQIAPGGSLHEFHSLFTVIEVVEMAQFGLPQSRKRTIAGRFPIELLRSYRDRCPRRTLGEVVSALSKKQVRDPIYSTTIKQSELTDNELETPLSPEELRMNRDAKTHHPVYNKMMFPDSLSRTARTVTATCTRVSRESCVIEVPGQSDSFRRLTVRERACLQSFPIQFKFFGSTHGEKVKMIGNAIPPLFTYYLANSMRGTDPSKLVHPTNPASVLTQSAQSPKVTPPESPGATFKRDRRFCSAIPGLRFGSGVRFELNNSTAHDEPRWKVAFFFGSSKKIREVVLDQRLRARLDRLKLSNRMQTALQEMRSNLAHILQDGRAATLQEVWTHRSLAGLHPFELTDLLASSGERCLKTMSLADHEVAREFVVKELRSDSAISTTKRIGSKKHIENASRLLVGFLVGVTANDLLGSDELGESRELASRTSSSARV